MSYRQGCRGPLELEGTRDGVAWHGELTGNAVDAEA
jgi:hypothetical protein